MTHCILSAIEHVVLKHKDSDAFGLVHRVRTRLNNVASAGAKRMYDYESVLAATVSIIIHVQII